jgi:hypothetical protein
MSITILERTVPHGVYLSGKHVFQAHDLFLVLLVTSCYINRSKFAAEALDINTVARIGKEMGRIQWIWDKRKTKTGTEARSVEEGYKTR